MRMWRAAHIRAWLRGRNDARERHPAIEFVAMAATTPTYYDVLRVDRGASPDMIRRAYRRLAQQYHPDKMPGNVNASRAMAAINAAYEVLSDAHQRAEHDRWIHSIESRPMPLSPGAAVREVPEAAWPWYLLFATMAFATATVGTAVYLTAFRLH